MNQSIVAQCTPDDPCSAHDPCPAHAELAAQYLALVLPAGTPATIDSTPPASSELPSAGGQDDPRRIVYNDITHRYRAYWDDHIVTDCWTQHDADVALDDYELSLLQDEMIDRVPTSVFARPAEPAPEPIEVKAEDEPLTNHALAAIFADNILCLPVAPITIATDKGARETDALILGDWALNENSQGWTVTHRKSGYAGKSYPTPVEALIELGVIIGAGLVAIPDDISTFSDIPDIGNIAARIKAGIAVLDSWDLDLDYNERDDTYPRPAEPAADLFYACPCLAPLALTCETCLIAKPERDFTATLAAPLSSPVVCDACMAQTASPTLPDEQPAATPAAPILTKSATTRNFWRCADGHDFAVLDGAVPLACPECEPAPALERDPACELRTMLALMRATLEAWKCLEVPTHYDDELAALDRQVARVCKPRPVCMECGGPHQTATCPKIKVERQRQDTIAYGKGVWQSYTGERARFLCALARSDDANRTAMAEALALYLSDHTNTALGADRVLSCWSKELAARAAVE